jgi:hypothetical protein
MRVQRKSLFFILGLLFAVAVPAGAGPMSLKVGAAKTAGVVSFTLHHTASGDSYAVQASIAGPLDAGPKAQAVASAVADDVTASWRAVVAPTGVAFQHRVDLTWLDVDNISDLVDTTGSGSKLSTTGNVVDFTLDIDPDAMATGLDAQDAPSFVTVSLTDTLSWTLAIQYGQTAPDLLDRFELFLRSEAGEGVLAVRQSPNELRITLLYDSSQMNWQITDTGLQPAAKGGGYSTDWPIGSVDRRRR